MFEVGMFYMGVILATAVYISVPPPVNAIVEGHDSNITRQPYVVSIHHNDEQFCGGSIIQKGWDSMDWIVTSAQCATKYTSDLTVRVYSSYASYDGEVYEVDEIHPHPGYNSLNKDSDIALLKLKESIPFDPVWGANLPYLDGGIAEDVSVTITGWGRTSAAGNYSETLQMGQIPARTLEQCRSCYTETSVTDNMFCAGYVNLGNVNRTSCEGDYGGPGMVNGWLTGVQSWGRSCGIQRFPTVFVKVINFVPWITEVSGVPAINTK